MFSCCCMVLFGCKKSDSGSASQNMILETGIYEGTLTDFNTRQSIAKFQVSVSKVGDNTFQITQISNGSVPVFTMTDKNHNYPFIMCTIATQTYQSQRFSGSGGASGGFDAVYNSTTKSLYFGIALASNLNQTIIFNGYKP